MSDQHVIYASSDWGIHDQRWVAALEACGFEVTVITSSVDLRAEVDLVEPSDAPVLAGPLSTVTGLLVGLSRPIVGLSWGYDLQPGHSAATSLASLDWLPQVDRLIVDSPSTRAVALSLGLPEDRIHLLLWGIDLAAFSPAGPAADHGFPAGSRVVLSLRTHDALYRTSDVIEAFGLAADRDPHLCLVMGGSGPLTAEHADRIHAFGLDDRTHFTGQVAEEEVAALLRSADLYVTASETDGTSVSLLQAMACGVPVVASDNPGNDWWIEEGVTGHRFAVGDITTLADLMVAPSGDPSMIAQAEEVVRSRADWMFNRLALRDILLFSATS